MKGGAGGRILQPALKLGFAVMTNQLGPETAKVNRTLVNAILGSLDASTVPVR